MAYTIASIRQHELDNHDVELFLFDLQNHAPQMGETCPANGVDTPAHLFDFDNLDVEFFPPVHLGRFEFIETFYIPQTVRAEWVLCVIKGRRRGQPTLAPSPGATKQ